MKQIDITKETYGERINKSPSFAKDVIITLSDDISIEVMNLFRKGKVDKWMNPMLKELIIDWNLVDEKGKKLPITVDGLDRIKSIKLRNWIIITIQEFIVESLGVSKKK